MFDGVHAVPYRGYDGFHKGAASIELSLFQNCILRLTTFSQYIPSYHMIFAHVSTLLVR